MTKNRLMILLTAGLLAACILCAAFAEDTGSDASSTSAAAADAKTDVTVNQGQNLLGNPNNVTVEVTNNADAASTGDGSATATATTTVTVKTGEDIPFDYLPVPPYQPKRHSGRSSSSKVLETLVKYTPATGVGFTLKPQVNVRATVSLNAPRVTVVRSSGTTVTVLGEAINSIGETWYAVKLYDDTVGYILASLVDADVEYLVEESTAGKTIVQYVYVTAEPAAAATPVPTAEPTAIPAANVTPEIIYITVDSLPNPTPTPIYVYVTPTPAPAEDAYDAYDTYEGEPING